MNTIKNLILIVTNVPFLLILDDLFFSKEKKWKRIYKKSPYLWFCVLLSLYFFVSVISNNFGNCIVGSFLEKGDYKAKYSAEIIVEENSVPCTVIIERFSEDDSNPYRIVSVYSDKYGTIIEDSYDLYEDDETNYIYIESLDDSYPFYLIEFLEEL